MGLPKNKPGLERPALPGAVNLQDLPIALSDMGFRNLSLLCHEVFRKHANSYTVASILNYTAPMGKYLRDVEVPVANSAEDIDILRVAVMFGNVRTSISIDGILASYLTARLGGVDELRAWAKETVAVLEREWEEKASRQEIGSQVHAKTGLSRAVQREAFKLLLDGQPAKREVEHAH